MSKKTKDEFGMMSEVISVQRLPDYGYELRTEQIMMDGDDEPLKMVSAYSLKGNYIGNAQDAYYLCRTLSIRPEVINKGKNVCSIGFCKKEQKWYGWSHRARFGFGIGDIVKKGDSTASSGYTDEYLADNPDKDLSLPIGFKAETLDDVKRMAIAFADSVS